MDLGLAMVDEGTGCGWRGGGGGSPGGAVGPPRRGGNAAGSPLVLQVDCIDDFYTALPRCRTSVLGHWVTRSLGH